MALGLDVEDRFAIDENLVSQTLAALNLRCAVAQRDGKRRCHATIALDGDTQKVHFTVQNCLQADQRRD